MAFKKPDFIDYDSCYEIDCDGECEPFTGCSVGFTIGPCDALDESTGLLDLSDHCQLLQLTSLTFNPNQEILQKQYLGRCDEKTKRGRFTWSIDFAAEVCDQDEAMCRLLNYGCLATVCLMPRGQLYDPNLPSDQQLGIIYGKVRIGSGSWEFPFGDEQSISGTLQGHCRLYRHGFCLNSAFGPDLVSTPITEEDKMVKSASMMSKVAKEGAGIKKTSKSAA